MLTIDSTQLKCFINCRKRYENNYVKKLRKKEYATESVDLLFGTAIHSAMEVFYSTGMKEMQPAVDKFREEFNDVEEELCKTSDNGEELINDYKNYHDHNFSEFEILGTEQLGELNFNGIKYLVKIDLVVKWKGNIYVVDFKTTKSTRKTTFFDKFNLDIQPTGYIKWCKDTYGECAGFIPIAMFVGHRKRAYKGEPAGFHCSFDFTIVNRTQEHLEDWMREVNLYGQSIMYAKKMGIWLKNTDYCSSYKGCQYKQACISFDDESVIESLYEQFDPFSYLNGRAHKGKGKKL